jgi:hypothetical protein
MQRGRNNRLEDIRHCRTTIAEAFGFRDKAAGSKMTTDAIFNIASRRSSTESTPLPAGRALLD